ncbi:MAG: hypothetical protein OEV72_13045 [Thermoleophilia bacterium]|nr:hypothetical protein [Thermoleophilia bacterium]
MSGVLLYVRLAAATAVVLAPGWAIARAIGVSGVAATLSWSLGALFAALAVTFAVSGSLTLTLVLLLAVGAAAVPFVLRRRGREPWPPHAAVAAALGVLLGILLWQVAGEIGGDGFFHLGRARKLLALDDLSLDALNEFPDGSLHPGYAFPLWHGVLALVAKIGGIDPTDVVLHLPSVLAPLAVLAWLEAGWALFRRAGAAAGAAATAVALIAFAPGHGGAYTALALPATTSRQLLVPAALALAFALVRRPTPALVVTTAVASLALAVTHPSYAPFVCVPFAGFLLVRVAWTRRDLRSGALALGALALPAFAFFVWLLPIVRDTAAVSPDEDERLRAFRLYEGQLDVRSVDSFSVVPDLFGRTGAAAVAALLLVPLAALAARRRWSAYVVGGALAVAALTLVPVLFTAMTDVVSISQGRRLVGFFPFPFALAGGMGVLAALLGPLVAPAALVGGIVLQLVYEGDFEYRLTSGGPAWATWVAVGGGIAALAYGFLQRSTRERSAGTATALLLLPVFVAGLFSWSPDPARRPSPLSAGLVAALRAEVPTGAVVYGDPEASYRIAAAAPVSLCVSAPGHVADTEQNRPRERVAEFRVFARTGDLAIPRACGATWLVVDGARFDLEPRLPLVYADARWRLYRLSGTGSTSGGTSG